MKEKTSLKDILFNKTKVEKIAQEIVRAYPQFHSKKFTRDVLKKFPALGLKARIAWIAECLRAYLPSEYSQAVKVVLRALPAPNNPDLQDDDFGDFIYASYGEFVALYGCREECLDVSLDALYHITRRFSAEDAIRYFINAFPEQTLQKVHAWVKDEHYHVRRLCSEGTRPKLPWSQKIILSVQDTIPIVNALFSDKTRFVTRSVANHMNDISKIDEDLAIETLALWKSSQKQNEKEMQFIINHALRSLIKQGNEKALALLGVSSRACVNVKKLEVPAQVFLNSHLQFSCTVDSFEDAPLIIDYVIHFQNKAGKMVSKKVYKLKKIFMHAGEQKTLSRKHLFRENMTTRKIFCGTHMLEVQINGKICASKKFEVVK